MTDRNTDELYQLVETLRREVQEMREDLSATQPELDGFGWGELKEAINKIINGITGLPGQFKKVRDGIAGLADRFANATFKAYQRVTALFGSADDLASDIANLFPADRSDAGELAAANSAFQGLSDACDGFFKRHQHEAPNPMQRFLDPFGKLGSGTQAMVARLTPMAEIEKAVQVINGLDMPNSTRRAASNGNDRAMSVMVLKDISLGLRAVSDLLPLNITVTAQGGVAAGISAQAGAGVGIAKCSGFIVIIAAVLDGIVNYIDYAEARDAA
jgi:hypothetical protein